MYESSIFPYSVSVLWVTSNVASMPNKDPQEGARKRGLRQRQRAIPCEEPA